MTQQTVAVIGPGAIGSTVAAWLAQDRALAVTVAARTAVNQLLVQTPDGAIEAAPRVITRPAEGSTADWILVATKAYDAASAALWFDSLCGKHSVIAVLQNGVEHVERFAPYVDADRILPVMVDIPAERTGRGQVHQRRHGRMIVPQTQQGAGFAALFRHTPIEVAQSNDIRSELWRKLCVNAAGALSAILLKPAVIARHDGVAGIMEGIVRECIAVGRAEGAALEDALAPAVVQGYRATPDAINSIHADRAAGRPMEIDARNGVIVRLGRKHGIPTPLNAIVVAMLEAATSVA